MVIELGLHSICALGFVPSAAFLHLCHQRVPIEGCFLWRDVTAFLNRQPLSEGMDEFVPVLEIGFWQLVQLDEDIF